MVHHQTDLREGRMQTVHCFVMAVACFLLLTQPAPAPVKPRLLAIDGYMAKGATAELDPEVMKRRFSLADIARLHFDGKSTEIEGILKLMAGAEKLRARIDEPLEVHGEIPVTLPPNTTGSEAYTTCFYAFNLNGLAVAGLGEELVLIRPDARPDAPRLERKWNRDQILPIRLFRLGYLRSDPILAQYKDKLGTKAGRAILEARSNVVIVSDKASSLERLERYIDVETVQAMGVPAAAGHTAAEGLRPPSLGAVIARANVHFYLVAFARLSQIPISGSKKEGVFDRHYPEADVWVGERGYRMLESEFRRIDAYAQLARKTGGQDWPVLDDERTLSPAEQSRLAIHFGVVIPDPQSAPPTNAKTKTKARKNAGKR
jgi:hypothetical protein